MGTHPAYNGGSVRSSSGSSSCRRQQQPIAAARQAACPAALKGLAVLAAMLGDGSAAAVSTEVFNQELEGDTVDPELPPAWHKILRVNLSSKNLHSVPRLEPLLGLKQLDLSANQISKIEGV